MWASFLLGLVAGISATPHCLGMCGGFPLHLAKSSGKGQVFLRQLLFVMGKSVTYMFLGALAASLGVIVLKDTQLAKAAPVIRLAAGIITLIFGLLMLGIKLPSIKPLQNISDAGFIKSIFGGLLISPGPLSALVLGLCVGFIPCPLPIVMLGVSAASHNVLYGIILMAGVGVGTAPGLLGVGLCGAGLNRRFAKVGMKLAGVVVVSIALLTIGRASGMIPKAHPINYAIPSCCGGGQH